MPTDRKRLFSCVYRVQEVNEVTALAQRRALWSAENEALPQPKALWSDESEAKKPGVRVPNQLKPIIDIIDINQCNRY